MAENNTVARWKQDAGSDGSDSDDETQMMQEYLKQRKLMKKMKKEQGKSGVGVGEIVWQRDSSLKTTKWGADFDFQKGMMSPLGIRGGIGYESRSETKSVKAVAKFPF